MATNEDTRLSLEATDRFIQSFTTISCISSHIYLKQRYVFLHRRTTRVNGSTRRLTSFFWARGKPPGYCAISFWAHCGRGSNICRTARPERILAHIPRALRLVHSGKKSGDRSRSARLQCLRAGNQAYRTVHDTTYGLKHQPHTPVNILRGATSDRIKF